MARNEKPPFRGIGADLYSAKEGRRAEIAACVRRQEEEAAALLSSRGAARRRPGSGSNPNAKGDAVSMKDLGECKLVMDGKSAISIKRSVLAKIQHEAAGEGKRPFLHIKFAGVGVGNPPDTCKSWVVIQDTWFQELLETYERYHAGEDNGL